jgi:hypothetical protein
MESGTTDGSLNEARFRAVTDIVSDENGNLYLADKFSIRKISAAGQVTTIAGPNYSNGAQYNPGGLALDKATNSLYITDVLTVATLIKIDLSKL